MSKRKALNVILVTVLVLMLTSIRFTVAQEQTEKLQRFLDFRFAEIEIQVNAPREALPEESMNVTLLVRSKADDIRLESLNLTVCGFIEGENKTVLGSIYRNNVPLSYNKTIECNDTFSISEDKQIWGATYGELSFQYHSAGGISLSLPSIGFTMSHVRNIYLENIEEEYQKLNENLTKLKQNHTWLEGKYTELSGNYTELKRKYGELSEGAGFDNTRHIAIILAVTTVVLGATTVYLIIRKPKQTW